MTAPTPKRRSRLWFAAMALTVGLAAGCTAGAWEYDSPPAAGVQADADTIKARNFLVVADDSGNGTLLGTVTSAEAVSLTGVAVQAETSDGGRAEPVFVDVTADISRNGSFVIDSSNGEVSGANFLMGRTATVGLQFSDGSEIRMEAPVLSSEHPDFQDI